MDDLISRAAAIDAISTDGGCGMCARRVLDIPAVDAIPVEWLRKWPKDLREGAYVRDILRDWQKEQEAR